MEEQKPRLDFPRKIALGYSPIHYRGVFATEDIRADEIIERCPMVVLNWRMNYQKDPAIWAYCFTNSCPCEECKKHGGHFLMVLGYGQIYNHQDNNNASIKFDMKNQTADIVCLRPIKKGDEIFVNYGPSYFQNRNKVTANEGSMNSVFSDSCTSQVFKPL
jgi:SET domain-containing protein